MFNLGFVGGGCRGRSEICCRLVCENSVDGLVWEGGEGRSDSDSCEEISVQGVCIHGHIRVLLD